MPGLRPGWRLEQRQLQLQKTRASRLWFFLALAAGGWRLAATVAKSVPGMNKRVERDYPSPG